VFQDFALVNGTWDVRNPQGKPERVKPADIKTTALMSVEGELDDISGAGQTEAVHDICSGVPKSRQRHFEAKGAGHYGIFSGRRWREHVYPQVKAFIKAHTAPSDQAEPAAKSAPAPAKPAAQPIRAKKVAPTLVKTASIAPKKVAVKRSTKSK
jgi:poly(3-hydroxybutyrate) depolymerase